MPRWKPVESWKDRDVYIIGGGDSLRTFEFDLLKPECTIGCNDAYTLGESVCKICIFGDMKWFNIHRFELMKFKGLIFTSHHELLRTREEWIWTIERQPKGLSLTKLCWNKSTGANAINLALILGAKRVYLLGFDCKLSSDNKPNWHDHIINPPNAEVYKRFNESFNVLKSFLPRKFPGREIINITDDSNLDAFPKIGIKEWLLELHQQQSH